MHGYEGYRYGIWVVSILCFPSFSRISMHACVIDVSNHGNRRRLKSLKNSFVGRGQRRYRGPLFQHLLQNNDREIVMLTYLN